MALVVDQNTYINEADADEYFASRYNSSFWTGLASEVKEVLLVSAARALDLFCEWSGDKEDSDQPLVFPRYGQTTPLYVKYAQCEIAASIFQNNTVVNETEASLKKLKVDTIEFIFNDVSSTRSLYNSFVIGMLSPYCSYGGGNRLTRV